MGSPKDVSLNLLQNTLTPRYHLLPEGALALNNQVSPPQEVEPEVASEGSGESSVAPAAPTTTTANLTLSATFFDKPRYGIKVCKGLGIAGIIAGTGLMAGSLGAYFGDSNRTPKFFDSNNTVPLILLGVGVGVSFAGGVALGVCFNQ